VPFYNEFYKEFMKAYLADDKKAVAFWINKARGGKWYKQTMAALGDLDFQQEYECNFDASTDSVFTEKMLAGIFRNNYLEHDYDDYGDVYSSEPIAGHIYVQYIDYGRKRDPLVSVVFDTSEFPSRLVEFKRIRPSEFDFTEVKQSIFRSIKKFGSECFHDGTGNGDVLTAFLEGWSTPRVMGDNGISKLKTNMIEKLKIACDTKAIVIPKLSIIVKEFKAYKYNDKKLVQDCVMAIGGAVNEFFEPSEEVVPVDSGFSYLQGAW